MPAMAVGRAKGVLDEPVQHPFSGKIATHQHPGEQHPHRQVDQSRQDGGKKLTAKPLSTRPR